MNYLKKLMLFRPSMPEISLIKTGYDTKITEIEKKITDHDHNNKYLTTQKFKKWTAKCFPGRLKQANLATEADIDDFVEKTNFDEKVKI